MDIGAWDTRNTVSGTAAGSRRGWLNAPFRAPRQLDVYTRPTLSGQASGRLPVRGGASSGDMLDRATGAIARLQRLEGNTWISRKCQSGIPATITCTGLARPGDHKKDRPAKRAFTSPSHYHPPRYSRWKPLISTPGILGPRLSAPICSSRPTRLRHRSRTEQLRSPIVIAPCIPTHTATTRTTTTIITTSGDMRRKRYSPQSSCTRPPALAIS